MSFVGAIVELWHPIWFSLGCSSPIQVTLLRQKLGRDHDDQLIYIDGKGIKILFNYGGLRRFMSGQSSRDPYLMFMFLSQMICCGLAILSPKGCQKTNL